jgi:mono/diheme cytochrome c family protein
VFRGAVPKWQYSPNDVFEELQKEGSLPQLIKPKADKSDPLAALRHRLPPLWASLQPQLLPATESSAAAAEKQESPPHKDDSPLFNYVEGPPGENYYIKKEFYTPENIAEGRRFFELNCAACHGKEGDGTGLRAGTMVEAKPRMLTNLDWLKTRDDMDLLRSIKYGVAGTAMIPWGDQTSSMQRLQLVMFIHTLSEQRLERDKLAEAIYRAFDRLDALIEQARAAGYGALASSKKQLAVVKQQLKDADRSASSNPTAQRSALELYQQELKLRGLLQMEAAADGKLLAIKAALKKEKELYQAIGSILIQQEQVDSLAALIALLQGLNDRYALKDGVLTLVNQDNRQQQAEKQIAAISSNFDLAIADVQQKKSLLENQPASTGRSQQLSDINGKITTMQEAKMRTAQLFTQAQELASQGATLLQQQNKQGE